jgi:hypothetical protein
MVERQDVKEEAMPARTTRQQARQRVMDAFVASLDRIIPPDESVPLRGGTFRDWEQQVGEMRRAVLPTVLEERSALEETARVESGGPCPRCGSARVYLEKGSGDVEVVSPDGPVVVHKQHARCRACGGSFSPPGPGLGAAGGGEPDAAGGRAGRA